MIVGYFRRVDLEEVAALTVILRAERCLRIEYDDIGRSEARRSLIADLNNGDVIVSPSIGHLAASVPELLRVSHHIHRRGATLRLPAEKIDTSIPAARNALAALAQFERGILSDRRQMGLDEAKMRGAMPGRPRKLDGVALRNIREDLAQGRSYAAIARSMNVHPTTIMRLIQRADAENQE